MARRRRTPLLQDGTSPRGTTEVVGMRRAVFTDLYYFLLHRSWSFLGLGLVGLYLIVNAIYAELYILGGDCLANTRPGDFSDAFFFSVQTLATIGYGYVYPKCLYTNILVTSESFLGLTGVAVATGIAFNKFARPKARVQFSRHAVVGRHDGETTLMFRVANERTNYLADATLSVTLVHQTTTKEGRSFTRLKDLPLLRDRSPMFTLTWTAMHVIDPRSPLSGMTPEALIASRALIVCTLSGFDAVTGQTMHSRHAYRAGELRFGHRLVDILTPASGTRGPVIDFTRFHDVEADPSAA